MNSILLNLFIGLMVGIVLGGLYFWGLWATVRRLAVSRRPWLLALTSFIFRAGLFLAAMFLVTRGRPVETVACVAGFVAARLFSTKLPPPVSTLQTRKETP